MVAPMIDLAMLRIPRALGLAAVALTVTACGPSMSGIAFGKIGRGVEAHAQSAPQGAEVCALQDALAAPNTGSEKPAAETCARALKNDHLWRHAMLVLGAYGESLETVALGVNADSAGQIESARTGVKGSDWIEVDGTAEQAARDAAAQLASQMSGTSAKGDLARYVKEAAPRVKTLCEGLNGYLEAQSKSLGDIEKDAEKKHIARMDRRCAQLDSRTVCVSESVVDRMFYATLFGQAALLENAHVEAHDAVAGFCAAHAKLESAASEGRLGSDKTYGEVVDAVSSAHRAKAAAAPGKAKK
jgi:hypothetical protein